MNFSLTIQCKPYVKRFLELNYGTPVNFIKDTSIYPLLRKKLERKSTRYDKKFSGYKQNRYTSVVEIKITRDDFYRYGWELSLTDEVNFNREMEGRAKLFMYTIISTRIIFGMNLTDAIRYFQNRFEFPETVWPAETIEKDCKRNLTVQKNECIEYVSQIIDKITMVKLSEKGTMSHIARKTYENTTI
jgi:transposase-like protein